MKGMMKTAVMTAIGKMELTERPIPSPAPGEVLVKVEYVGICGSDLHYFESGRIGDYVVKPPLCWVTKRAALWLKRERA